MKAGAFFLWCLFTSAAALMLCASAVATTPDESANVSSTVEAFHNALAHGDGKAAMKSLAPGAVILESGSAESRAEYENHHLPEDIQFAQAVHSERSDIQIQEDGNTAWVTSRSKAEGSFEGKPINSVGVELVVLTKTAEGWRIRAIHWSSHKVKTE